ncbi:magnesium chelatase family protein [Oceanicella actignis]|nr:YifB family Mg chelatase-like AAA ATPase [Oceanicella actignis]TYO84816.1 magnesium chelatase family protein [Oceanicella actignis]
MTPSMTQSCHSVAFVGIEARPIRVECMMTPGVPSFSVVGLPDKAVAESRERVRAALASLGVSIPPRKIVVNLSPADLPKKGAHYDLPIAICIMAGLGVLPPDPALRVTAIGELGLDGAIRSVTGALPAALAAAQADMPLVCPAENGPEAALVGAAEILAPASLLALVNHYNGKRPLPRPSPAGPDNGPETIRDLADVKGQERARRALELAAAGGHNLLLIGPPGVGKSMLAERLPGILPPLTPEEALETTMIRSVAGLLERGAPVRRRPFCAPHHSASMAALAGGGRDAAPGQVSLAHNGVLFLDELPEFSRPALESLRQPLESGVAAIARANAHVTYPASVQLVAAMNPCRCGQLADPSRACNRAPKCGQDYRRRISGPLLDRIDLHVETPAQPASELARLPQGEPSAAVAARVARARERQAARWREAGVEARVNARVDGAVIEKTVRLSEQARALLIRAADRLGLSARGWTRVLRVALTAADLDGAEQVGRAHVAEAVSYRMPAV